MAGVEYEIDANKKVKAKFDLARNLSIAGKLKFNDRFNVKTAVNVPVKKEEWKKISYGIEWELTI